jgi:hypothetical protein
MSQIRGTVKDKRDGQKSRLYSWEEEVIAPHGGAVIGIGAAQGVIDHIWAEVGLQYPPKVQKFQDNVTTKWATGNRFNIQMHSTIPTWVLLHELAHSMTSTHEGSEHGHNENYVGMYMLLCEKFLKIDYLYLQHTATMRGIKFNLSAKPTFLE